MYSLGELIADWISDLLLWILKPIIGIASGIWELVGEYITKSEESFMRHEEYVVKKLNETIQRHPAANPVMGRSVYLRSLTEGGVEIVVNDKIYHQLTAIEDSVARNIIQSAMKECQIEQLPTSGET